MFLTRTLITRSLHWWPGQGYFLCASLWRSLRLATNKQRLTEKSTWIHLHSQRWLQMKFYFEYLSSDLQPTEGETLYLTSWTSIAAHTPLTGIVQILPQSNTLVKMFSAFYNEILLQWNRNDLSKFYSRKFPFAWMLMPLQAPGFTNLTKKPCRQYDLAEKFTQILGLLVGMN